MEWREARKGFLLIVGMFVLIPLSTLAGAGLNLAVTNLAAAHRTLAEQQAFYLAESGLEEELVLRQVIFTHQQITDLVNTPLRQVALPGGTYAVHYEENGNPNDDIVVLVAQGTATLNGGTVTKTLRATLRLPLGDNGVFDYVVVAKKFNLQGGAVIGEPLVRAPIYIADASYVYYTDP